MEEPNPQVERILRAARDASLPCTAEAANALCAYVTRLIDQPINVTAAKTVDDAIRILVIPSLSLAASWPRGRDRPERIVDIGSGNGFPGMVAAYLWPAAKVLLVERRSRKARAIAACIVEGERARIRVATCDARELKREHPAWMRSCDLVTARAVGPLGEVTRMAAPMLAPGGRIVHWKDAESVEAERADGQRAAQTLGLRVHPYIAPRADLRQRLIVYERPE